MALKVPIIAITPEAEEDDDHNYSTLVLTDVETLELDDRRRRPRRSKLMVKLTEGGAVTDTEDVEGSGDEDDVVAIVPYDKPASIDDLDLDPGECKETHKIRTRNGKGRRKLHTQSSTVTESQPRLADNFEAPQGTTDVEECGASSDEDPRAVEESTVPNDLLEATRISERACVFRRVLLGEESDSDGQVRVVAQRRKVKRRKNTRQPRDYNIQFGDALSAPQPAEEGLTDVERLDSNEDSGGAEIPVAIVKRCKKGNSTDEEVVSDPDPSYQIQPLPEVTLPKPYRKLITVRDTRERPIVTITPIDDDYRSEFRLEAAGDTDEEEFLSDTDALLFAEALSRGPTPELSIFDGAFDDVTESVRMRRRRSLKPTIAEELTDTEDLVLVGLSSLTIARHTDHDATDLESVLMSDDEEYLNEKVDLLRALSSTPISMREMGGDTVWSMEGLGPFTDATRLSVNRRISLPREYLSPMPTDTEDVCVSDAEEAPVMYLKGGGGGSFREVCTDTEDANASDDEYHACLNKKKFSVDILSDNNVLVSKTCANLKGCSKSCKEWDATGKSSVGAPVFNQGKPAAVDAERKGEVATGLPEASTHPRQQVPFRDVGEEGGDGEVPAQGPSSGHSSQRYTSDQHQLSEEMKQLLRDMEEESKK